MIRAYIGIGGNVGDETSLRQRFRGAVERLEQSPMIDRVRCSRLYVSAPVGPVRDQPAFVNAALALELADDATPHALLEELQRTEAAFGRNRSRETPQGPRTLDLDLLLFGDLVCADTTPQPLVIPHPRLCERAFALVPLIELGGAELTVPGTDKSLGDCLRPLQRDASALHLL